MIVRKAEEKDLAGINSLLGQVLELHAALRPDLFVSGTKKYSDEELLAIFQNERTPVFVAEEDGAILGHAFCEFKERAHSENMTDIQTLYIDDICVDQNARGKRVGQALLDHCEKTAQEAGCYNITLNVWNGNDGAYGFYEHAGMKIQKYVMEKILEN